MEGNQEILARRRVCNTKYCKNNLPFGSYSTKKPADAKDVPQVTNVTPTEDIVFNDQTLPAGQMVASLPRSFVQANSSKFKTKDQVAAETAAEVRSAAEAKDAKKTNDMTFLEAGTYTLPTGVEITVEEGETRPFNPRCTRGNQETKSKCLRQKS